MAALSTASDNRVGASRDGSRASRATGPRYKWVALSNTTLGVLMATLNSSILLIALPNIFRGIKVNPLVPGNASLLLWLIMGFLVVTAVLVVSLGRVGDMFGRVKMYNLGFAVFTIFSVLLSVTWFTGTKAALWLIVMRIGQGVGGAFLFANSSAILTDAFPEDQRGMALGINGVAAIAGSFIGLILGGLLGPVSWRLVFLVSVPFGIFGTVWAYLKLVDTGVRTPSRIDWWGNLTFAVGLISVLVGIVYGIEPYGGHDMGWTNPGVLAAIIGGVLTLAVFGAIETKVENPMFRLPLFRIRAFTAGNFASLLAALGRGGLMFILIIWLQGIWLPEHGFSFAQTPLWAGIYMLPLTAGFLVAGPLSGILSDRFGARPFATGGMVVAAVSFGLLELLPVNFSYLAFAGLILLNGLAMGLFASPNRAGIMNSLPPNQRGAGAGMSATFQNSAMVLSIGIFFTLIVLGLSSTLPSSLYHGLTAQGVPAAAASRISHLPPVGTLFAALLGYNPVKSILGPGILGHLSAAHVHYLTGRSFFPRLISLPFAAGLREAFDFAVIACLVAAVASWLRGGRYVYQEGAELARAGRGVAGGSPDGVSGLAEVPAGAPAATSPVTPPVAEAGQDLDAGGAGIPEPARAGAGGGPQGAARNGAGADGSPRDGDAPNGAASNGAALRATAANGTAPGDNLLPQGGTFARRGTTPVPQPAGGTPAGPEPGGQEGTASAAAARAAVPDEHAGSVSTEGAAHALAGTVRSSAGRPVPGAVVTVTDDRGRQLARSQAGPDGRYRLDGLDGGGGTAVITAPGHRSLAAFVDGKGTARSSPAERGQDFELALAPVAEVSGVVRAGSDGRPLIGMAVSLVDEAGNVVATTCSTEGGAYRFSGLADGTYTVVAAGYRPVAVPVAALDGGTGRADLVLGTDRP